MRAHPFVARLHALADAHDLLTADGAFAVWHGPAVRPEKFPRTTLLGRAQFRTPPRTTTLHKMKAESA